MKNISRVILLSTSCLIWYGADNVCASVNVYSGIPKSGTHNTLHTTPCLTQPHLPSVHPRGVADGKPPLAQARGGMFRTERSAMLTSCLPQALSSSSLSRGGWRKENNPVNCFLTTGESLLTGELVETTRSQCYKPSDRSGVAKLLSEAYEARRWGVTSEASISLSSKRYNLSFGGLIPPRELLTRLKSEEFLLPLPQGENNKLNVFKTASVCFITDTGACSGEKFSNDETPESGGSAGGNPGGIPDYDTPQEQCQAAGYNVTSCPAGTHGDNPCPADSSYYQKCVCNANMTETCTKPYYGVGPSCDGKYASCKRDDAKACKEDGYINICPSGQKLKKSSRCSYNNNYGICCTENCTNNSSTTCTGANTGDDGCGYACYSCSTPPETIQYESLCHLECYLEYDKNSRKYLRYYKTPCRYWPDIGKIICYEGESYASVWEDIKYHTICESYDYKDTSYGNNLCYKNMKYMLYHRDGRESGPYYYNGQTETIFWEDYPDPRK